MLLLSDSSVNNVGCVYETSLRREVLRGSCLSRSGSSTAYLLEGLACMLWSDLIRLDTLASCVADSDVTVVG